MFCTFVFIIIYCTDFYLFVLCSGLLISFLFQFTLVLYSTICSRVSPLCTWYFYQGAVLGYDFFPPHIVLVWIYLFINSYIALFFLPFSHFAHVDILLCFTATPVKISSFMGHISSKLH
jgi:hypothetical protein